MNYLRINLDEYTLSGAGGTALTYTHKTEKRLAKLFSPGFAADMAAQEFNTSKTVYELGIPTPRPIRLVTDGERYGAEYELIENKRSFARIISEEPECLEPLSKEFAKLARSIHATPADITRVPSMKQRKEAAEQYVAAGRQELADNELAEVFALSCTYTYSTPGITNVTIR